MEHKEQTIVINDLLCYIWCKHLSSQFPENAFISSVEKHFSEKDLEDAVQTLISALPEKISALQNLFAPENSIQVILRIFKNTSLNDLPIFVCKNLNNLPQTLEENSFGTKKLQDFMDEHEKLKNELHQALKAFNLIKVEYEKLNSKLECESSPLNIKKNLAQSKPKLLQNTKLKKGVNTSSKKSMCNQLRYIEVQDIFHQIIGVFRLYKCSACHFYTNDEATISKHICFEAKMSGKNEYQKSSKNEKSGEFQLKEKNECSKVTENNFTCFTCNTSFQCKILLLEHVKLHLGPGHQCPICYSRFDVEKWLEHIQKCSEKRFNLTEEHFCERCNIFYCDKRTLDLHKALHDKYKPFQCKDCSYRFYTEIMLGRHVRQQHNETDVALKCCFCAHYSRTRQKMEEHIRVHTGDKPFKCPKCDTKLSTYNSLNMHMQTHDNVKKFSCEICKKKFYTSGKRACHRRLHSTKRLYLCPVCGKSFKAAYSMATHYRNHVGIKKFHCSFCSYKGPNPTSLREHMNTHTNAKPFKCEKCPFRANHKSYLGLHRRTYHSH